MLIDNLLAYGLIVDTLPTLEIVPLPNPEARSVIIQSLQEKCVFVFTSANAVYSLQNNCDPSCFKGVQAAVVGESTAKAARDSGFDVLLTSPESSGSCLLQSLLALDICAFLICRGEQVATDLALALSGAGKKTREIILYRTTIPSIPLNTLTEIKTSLLSKSYQAVVSFSSQSLINLCSLLRDSACSDSSFRSETRLPSIAFDDGGRRSTSPEINYLKQEDKEDILQELFKIQLFVLGKRSQETALSLGFTNVCVSKQSSEESLLECITSYFGLK